MGPVPVGDNPNRSGGWSDQSNVQLYSIGMGRDCEMDSALVVNRPGVSDKLAGDVIADQGRIEREDSWHPAQRRDKHVKCEQCARQVGFNRNMHPRLLQARVLLAL